MSFWNCQFSILNFNGSCNVPSPGSHNNQHSEKLQSMKRLIFLCLFLVVSYVDLHSMQAVSSGSCESCEESIVGTQVLTAYDGSFTKRVCADCNRYARRCWVCLLPSHIKSRSHDDGRLFCDRDFAAAIFEPSEMGRLTQPVTQGLERALWRFGMKFPVANVTVSLVSCASLYDLLKVPFDPESVGLVGLTKTTCYDDAGKEVKLDERHKQPVGAQLRYEHSIYLANGLPELRLQGVLAHELSHVWVHENLPFERLNGLDRDTVEGFCEFVAYQLMEQDASPHGKFAIRNNLYTMGQQTMLLEIDQGYGFDRILKWFQYGIGRRLQNADQIRQVVEKPAGQRVQAAPNATASTNWGTNAAIQVDSAPPPILLSKEIVLKGVMFGKNKSALVNGLTFMVGDEQKVKLADGPVVVKCLEIKEASALLSVNGETKEFFVGPNLK